MRRGSLSYDRLQMTRVVVVILTVVALAGRVHAQRAEAQEAFERGRKLMKEGDYKAACASFETSLRLDPTNGTLYNLGLCHDKLGKLASAWAELKQVAETDTNRARAADAGKRAEALEPRLTRFKLVVPEPVDGLVIERDGIDITPLVGQVVPVDPRTYSFKATAPGKKPVTFDVALDREGETIDVEVPRFAAEAPPPPPGYYPSQLALRPITLPDRMYEVTATNSISTSESRFEQSPIDGEIAGRIGIQKLEIGLHASFTERYSQLTSTRPNPWASVGGSVSYTIQPRLVGRFEYIRFHPIGDVGTGSDLKLAVERKQMLHPKIAFDGSGGFTFAAGRRSGEDQNELILQTRSAIQATATPRAVRRDRLAARYQPRRWVVRPHAHPRNLPGGPVRGHRPPRHLRAHLRRAPTRTFGWECERLPQLHRRRQLASVTRYSWRVESESILAGRYRIGRTLGRGGMGIVLEATHIHLKTGVAIKVLRQEALEQPELIERFLREARSAARLKGEHVCRVTDFGTTEDGLPFMVMELLEGEDLREIVDDHGPMDPTDVATYVLQACIAVAEAHALGIVHRDLKPGNLFLVRQPNGRRTIKLLDFGIAKSDTFDKNLTATAKAMGSPAYMAPEQLKSGSQAEARSDIWSLGVTMFELLTEKRPFDGDTPYELAVAITNDQPAALPDTVPSELVKVVKRCLEKRLEKRFANVSELAMALAPLANNGKELASEVKAALVPPGDISSETRAERVLPESPMTETTLGGASGAIGAESLTSRPRWALPIALAAMIVVGVGGYAWWSRGDSEPAPAVRTTSPITRPNAVAVDAAPVSPPEPDAAAVEPDAALAAAPDAAEANTPIDAKKRKHHHRIHKRNPTNPVDLGSSRF